MRSFLRRRLPKPHQVREHRHIRFFGTLLHNPNLWHLNRNSVAQAVSLGLFLAFVPVPFQMVLAAAAAIVVGCNLPLAVAMVWISNPLTIPPLFYAAYKVGAALLDSPARDIQFELSIEWISTELGAIWEPFLLGCLILGLASGATGSVTVRLLWRLHVVRRWRRRKEKRALRAAAAAGVQPPTSNGSVGT